MWVRPLGMLAITSLGATTQTPTQIPANIDVIARAELKSRWDAATDQAKIELCKRLKQQFPNDATIQTYDCSKPLDVNVVVGTIGAAGGVAACTATGAGVIVASTCGAVGAWLANEIWSRLDFAGVVTGGIEEMSIANKYLFCYGNNYEQQQRSSHLYTPEALSTICKKWFPSCAFVPRRDTRLYDNSPLATGSCKIEPRKLKVLMTPGMIAAKYTKDEAGAGILVQPWYKRPSTYVAASAVAAATGGVVYFLKLRR